MPDLEKIHNQLKELFKTQFGIEPESIAPIAVSGSDRRYYRLSNNQVTAIGAYSPDRKENSTFFYLTRLFLKNKLPVPEIYQSAPHQDIYLLEDVGSASLFQIMEKEGHTERVKSLFKKSIDVLARFHWEAGQEVDFTMCYGSSVFDKQQIFADLLYFKYYFADPLKVSYNKQDLLKELELWGQSLSAIRPQTFMYRDFQSRNVQVQNDEVSFIDYQGGMLGAPQYDLASLLWQARAQLPPQWKNELLNYYFTAIKSLQTNPGFNESDFRKGYLEFVLLRILQTLGAYGFRGLIERKPHFIKSISPALHQLQIFLEEYPHLPAHNELRKVLLELVKPKITERFGSSVIVPGNATLTIDIYSFSYKKGIPADVSGHGGGFVFDCRGILNPGRIDDYKTQTGKDADVIEYLETKTKMPAFIESVCEIVDISVDDYLQRGFDHLSVSFGCTGGQHRSVYAAESLAIHLKEKYGLNATVLHLEQEQNEMKRR